MPNSCLMSSYERRTRRKSAGAPSSARPTSTRSLSTSNPYFQETWPSKSVWPQSCAGMHWRWWCGQTKPMESLGVISQAMRAQQTCLKQASTTFLKQDTAQDQGSTVVTWSFSNLTVRLGFIRVPTSKADCKSKICCTTVKKSRRLKMGLRASRATRIHGSCLSFGSSQQARWASVRSALFIMPALCAISPIATYSIVSPAKFGVCLAMVKWTSLSP